MRPRKMLIYYTKIFMILYEKIQNQIFHIMTIFADGMYALPTFYFLNLVQKN